MYNCFKWQIQTVLQKKNIIVYSNRRIFNNDQQAPFQNLNVVCAQRRWRRGYDSHLKSLLILSNSRPCRLLLRQHHKRKRTLGKSVSTKSTGMALPNNIGCNFTLQLHCEGLCRSIEQEAFILGNLKNNLDKYCVGKLRHK